MIEIMQIGERKIAIKGIGKMYYQDGFPIEMSLLILKDKGIEASIYHVADELLKNGFPPKRVISILKNDGINEVEEFCNSDYEKQREMIFDYLFSSKETAKTWLLQTIKYW